MATLDHIDDTIAAYLRTQRLGRLATVDSHGAPQNNPVGFSYDPELGVIDIGGRRMAQSRKFRNVQGNPQVAFVVDDLASTDPWRPRMVEIRGRAETLHVEEPPHPGMTHDIIRVHPERIFTFGLD